MQDLTLRPEIKPVEEIKTFNPIKIGDWVTVYLKQEMKDTIKIPFASEFANMSERN